jgi:transcriptional regulator with XRE-family HTH domain
MTGQDLKALRHALGLTTLQLGRALGYQGAPDTIKACVRRLECSQRTIPHAQMLLAMHIAKNGLLETHGRP